MQAVITHPGGIHPGAASVRARQSLEVDGEHLETVVTASATLTGAERLEIYGRSYHARLLETFRSMFPALLHALGEELFDRFALDYLEHHPPHSYSLNRLAEGFPQHLATTRPDAALPPEERASWPTFLIELAVLEQAFTEVYDGPGVEGQALPTEAELLELDPALLLASRLLPVPCLRLFAFQFPVDDYLKAVRREEGPDIPEPSAMFLAIHRLDYQVRFHRLSSAQYELLRALDGERTVAEALEVAAGRGLQEAIAAAMARSWLRAWVREGFFERVSSPGA
jgi:hypothetical protein